MTAIPEGGWIAEWDRGQDAKVRTLLGIGPRADPRRPMEDFLRQGDPWGHRLMAYEHDRRIDGVLDALLRHHGVRPDAMLLLSNLGAVPELRHGARGPDVSLMPHGNAGGPVRGIGWIGPEVRWEALDQPGEIVVRSPPPPEAVIASWAGRPLSRVVSHPALDPHGLVVASADADRIWLRIRLVEVPTVAVKPLG